MNPAILVWFGALAALGTMALVRAAREAWSVITDPDAALGETNPDPADLMCGHEWPAGPDAPDGTPAAYSHACCMIGPHDGHLCDCGALGPIKADPRGGMVRGDRKADYRPGGRAYRDRT